MTSVAHPAPETKAAGETAMSDIGQAFEEFMGAFEAFKDGNDDRLRQIERRLSADVVTEEKVARIDRALDEHKQALDRLVLSGRRPQLGTRAAAALPEVTEHKAAFDAYVRTGEMSGLRRLEEKAMSAGSEPDGGFLVPEETETEIGRRLALVSPIRSIAGVRQVSTTTSASPGRAGWRCTVRQVTSARHISGWANGETIRIGDPNPTGENVLQMFAVDISPYFQAQFGAVFRQKGVSLAVRVNSSGGSSRIKFSATGATGSAVDTNSLSDGADNNVALILPSSVKSPISDSNLVFMSEHLTTGTALTVCFARISAVLVG